MATSKKIEDKLKELESIAKSMENGAEVVKEAVKKSQDRAAKQREATHQIKDINRFIIDLIPRLK